MNFFLKNNVPLSLDCSYYGDYTAKPLFSAFDNINIKESVLLDTKTCPLIFQNANIKQLTINKLTLSNTLSFTSVNNGENELNSNIDRLDLVTSDLKLLDSRLINEFVFKLTKTINFYSTTSDLSVQADLFKPLRLLKEINFKVNDLSYLINNKNLQWLTELNPEAQFSPLNKFSQFKLVLNDLSQAYTFPDSDLCLFKNFPHSKWVFPVIYSKPDLDCSCTLLFLIQYYKYYDNRTQLETPSVRRCLSNLDNLVNACNFTSKLDKCKKCTFSNLVLDCSGISSLTEVDTLQPGPIVLLSIKPATKLRFDAKFSLALNNEKFQNGYAVSLDNFNGFEFNSNPFEDLKPRRGALLILNDLNFDFYSNVFNLLSSSCSFTNGFNYRPLFASFDNVFLGQDVLFDNKVCPLVFQNANIKKLTVNKLQETDGLFFADLINSGDRLNSIIEQYEVYNMYVKTLDERILNRFVFKDLNRLKLVMLNPIFRIDDYLFTFFKALKELDLSVLNYELFLKNQNSWVWSFALNGEIRVDLNNLTQLSDPANKDKQFTLKISDSSNVSNRYTFPEEDFCAFKDFPHSKLVFPVINSKQDLNCSCTLAYLLQYAKFYKNPIEINTLSVRNCLSNPNFEGLISACNFTQRIRNCERKNLIKTKIVPDVPVITKTETV